MSPQSPIYDNYIDLRMGDYTIKRVLANGGMARIYEGVDERLNRESAIKVLPLDQADEIMTLRFQKEARAIATLEHENIITIYQYGEQHGAYFIAMKLIRGKDLATEILHYRRLGQRMSIERALHLGRQVASALDYAHAQGIVHRDIKPSNILLDARDRAILTDFGLILERSSEATFGTAFGTPRYIAPEQALSSDQALPQSDIYSLGVILYELLAGRTPFNGNSPMEIALAHINQMPPSPRTFVPDMPYEVEVELLKILSKEPEKRHATAGEFIAALEKAYHGISQTAPQAILETQEMEVTASLSESWDDVIPTASKNAPSAKPKASLLRPLAIFGVLFGLILLAIALRPNDDASGIGMEMTDEFGQVIHALGAEANIVPILIDYDDSALIIRNTGDVTVATQTWRIQQGDLQVTGGQIPQQQFPVNTCFLFSIQGRNSALQTQCTPLHGQINYADVSQSFWRTSATHTSFQIYIGDTLVAECDAVQRGETSTCEVWVNT